MAENVIECSTACTVTIQLVSAPPDSDRLGDTTELAGYFFMAALVIFLAREFYNLWNRAPHAD